MKHMLHPKILQQSRSLEELAQLASEGRLLALVDGQFGPWEKKLAFPLNPKDTDPLLYEVIAWNDVKYKVPYVMALQPQDLNRFHKYLLTERWGIYLITEQPMQKIAQHFQKFVIARGPDMDPYFFKFQDAAVLEVFIHSWFEHEIQTFFGPVSEIGYTNLENLNVQFYRLAQHEPYYPLPEDCLLTLRKEQLLACQNKIEEDLIYIVALHLKSHHPQLVEDLNDETLFSRVAFGLKKARSYQFENVRDMAAFVGLMFEVAPNFDQHPLIQGVLKDRTIPNTSKLMHLAQQMSETVWREAALLYAGPFWPQNYRKTGS